MSSMRLALKLSMDESISNSSSNLNNEKETKKKKKENDNTVNDNYNNNNNDNNNSSNNNSNSNNNNKILKNEKKEKEQTKLEKLDNKKDQQKPSIDQSNEKSSNNANNKRKRAESEGDSTNNQTKPLQKRSMSMDQADNENVPTKGIPGRKKNIPEKEKEGINKIDNNAIYSIKEESEKRQTNNDEIAKKKIEKEKKVKVQSSLDDVTFNDEEIDTNENNDVTTDKSLETPSEKTKTKKRKSQGLIDETQLQTIDGEKEENTDSSTPRYQSNRAAAMVAKTKLSNTSGGTRSPRPDPEEEESLKEKKKKVIDENKSHVEEVEEAKWVQCDSCSKWRCLPPHVDMNTLPEKWYCTMNVWDNLVNNCDAPESSGEMITDTNNSKDNEHSNQMRLKGRWAGHIPKNKRKLGDEDEGFQSAKKRGARQFGQMNQKDVADKVDWVQCNKCNKWRKVPMSIDTGSLPEEWFCSLNTWNPMVARCTAKEEVDTLPIEDEIDKSAVRGKKGNASSNPTIPAGAAVGENLKKVTQWVQCERRNCKKWRKVPAHIDMQSLPEKWYCEMNIWDSERGSCDDPEPADSEDEKQQIASDRNQLLFANSKGSGALSYRRIIFGTDGKIRSSYNEKNKSVYGLFSFTEVHKQVDNEDYIEPSRRLSYWSSSAYDISGVTKNDLPLPVKKEKKDKDNKDCEKEKEKEKEQEKEKEKEKEKDTISCTTISINTKEPTILLDCIRKMNSSNPLLSSAGYYGSKSLKSKDFSLFERFRYESQIIRSILLNSSNKKISFSTLVDYIATSNFLNVKEEACRRSMNVQDIKAAVRRLELQGEIEVSLNGVGEVLIQSMKPCRSVGDPWDDSKWNEKSLPLRLRKGKDDIKAFKDEIKRQEDEKKRLKRRKEEEKDAERESILVDNKDEELSDDKDIPLENVVSDVDKSQNLEEITQDTEEITIAII